MRWLRMNTIGLKCLWLLLSPAFRIETFNSRHSWDLYWVYNFKCVAHSQTHNERNFINHDWLYKYTHIIHIRYFLLCCVDSLTKTIYCLYEFIRCVCVCVYTITGNVHLFRFIPIHSFCSRFIFSTQRRQRTKCLNIQIIV